MIKITLHVLTLLHQVRSLKHSEKDSLCKQLQYTVNYAYCQTCHNLCHRSSPVAYGISPVIMYVYTYDSVEPIKSAEEIVPFES